MITLGDLRLYEDDLTCHLHCWGKSGSGKSKCIECICRTLTEKGCGYVFLDPHGKTVSDLLKWFAFWKPKRKVYLLDTSERERIVGICPFWSESKDEEVLDTTVKACVSATMKAWGHDPLATPRLTKWLRRLYFTIMEQDLPLSAVDVFLQYKHPAREKILQRCSIRHEWDDLYKLPRKEFATYMESVESRMEMFKHRQIRRLLSLKENSIDLKKLWDNGDILLVSLKNSSVMGEEENRVIGSFLISQLAQLALQGTDDKKKLYLIIDECWKYLTPDFRSVLDETRKFGLSLLAFHQRLAQLDAQTASALHNAKTKIIFSTDAEPKPQRHFTLERQNGSRAASVMQNIFEYNPKPDVVQEYRQSLLDPFMRRQDVDRAMSLFDNEREMDEEDFLR